jgi:hypothetical protein
MKQGARSAVVLLAALAPVWRGLQPPVAATFGTQPPVLTSLAINDTATTVSRSARALDLKHVVAGARPVEYRISARADMANALWMPYVTPLQLAAWQSLIDRGAAACDGRRSGQRLQLYLQVRTELGGTVHIVSGQRVIVPQKIESNVVSDAICVVNER